MNRAAHNGEYFVYTFCALLRWRHPADADLPALVNEKIKPNPYYGFRIRATLEDPSIWYAVNKYFAKRLLIVGVLEAVTSLVLYLVPEISVDAYALSMLGVFVVAFSIAMAQSWKYMNSMSRQRDQ